MPIDILNLTPTTISRDLKGKYICIYGLPKVGKTTFAASAPKNLLLAFEKGYNGLGGIMAQDINKWSDLKAVLKQLERDEAKAMYDTVSIDTVSIMWDMCEEFICSQNNVSAIGDIPWGRGYSLCTKEFEKTLRKITMLGYGLIIIAHVDTRIEKDANGNEREFIGPAISKRPYAIVNQLVDVIGYIGTSYDENGNGTRYLFTRETPTLRAGSRFKHLPAKIPFGYDELAKALSEAIEKSGNIDGVQLVDKTIEQNNNIVMNRPFEETVSEGRRLWEELIAKDPNNAEIILNFSQKVFGVRKKLSEITKDEQALFESLIQEMKAL